MFKHCVFLASIFCNIKIRLKVCLWGTEQNRQYALTIFFFQIVVIVHNCFLFVITQINYCYYLACINMCLCNII